MACESLAWALLYALFTRMKTPGQITTREAEKLKLRDHPLMSYRGASNWPPVWVQNTPGGVKTLKGEIGVLKYVFMRQGPADKCYLTLEHQNQSFVGALNFDDPSFCERICRLLQSNVGRPIKQIGNLDIDIVDSV